MVYANAYLSNTSLTYQNNNNNNNNNNNLQVLMKGPREAAGVQTKLSKTFFAKWSNYTSLCDDIQAFNAVKGVVLCL